MSAILGPSYKPSGRWDAARLLPLLVPLTVLALALADGWFRLERRTGPLPILYAIGFGLPLLLAAAAVLRWGRVRNRAVAAVVNLSSVLLLIAFYFLLGLADAHSRGGGEFPGFATLLAELPEYVVFRARNQQSGPMLTVLRWATLAIEIGWLGYLAMLLSAVAADPFDEATGRWFPVRIFVIPPGRAAAWHRHWTAGADRPPAAPRGDPPFDLLRVAMLDDRPTAYVDLLAWRPGPWWRSRRRPIVSAASLPTATAQVLVETLAAGVQP